MADVTRASTMSGTAILRGFIENVYLTNFSPRLADPNMVDFAALQNIKPKQIIATNGNPQAAVAMLQPETISTGTVPLLAKLEGGSSAPAEVWGNIDTANVWTEYTFDFSGQAAENHQKIVLFFNGGETSGTDTDIYFIDDLKWQ